MKRLYNYSEGLTQSTTALINGKSVGINLPNNPRYPWAVALYDHMLSLRWHFNEADLTAERKSYREELLPADKRAYDLVMSQLVAMDAFNTNNLTDYINPIVTAPEINMCLAEQAASEALHSRTYDAMTQSVTDNADEIYRMYETDPILKRKNEFIADGMMEYGRRAAEGDLEATFLLFTATIALEGIYFYSNFPIMYALMRAGKVVGSGKEIQFIHRDEEIHTVLFANLFKVLKLENGLTDETVCKIYDLLRKATELEIEWGIHVTQNQILGINNADLGKYVKFLANERIKAMGLDKQYGLLYPEDTVNTMPWVDVAKNINGIKSDFFTSDVATYTVGTSNDDLFD